MLKSIVAGAAIVAALVTCGPAHADPGAQIGGSPDQYLSDLSRAGFNVSNKTLVMEIGLGVCVDLFQGATMSHEVEQLMKLGGTQKEAMTLVALAQKNLCPKTVTTGSIT
ncbi:hypothetical protein MINTM005_13600 [Mycobacterium intracellulare]|uniref:DUF732 domain-containing protein n=1 Tax=Mycobacterium intracellulare TaxID=1767 RepID=UPI001926B281|nr:DUF732 domain-containing protein [Mycobacterium intracellulare]BCO56116.1 hypothetical protein MINTM005_13600 [Mycobacterium intracellulare]